MARRGARGKGWIRLMRIIVWVLAVLIFLGGIILGIATMGASDATQTATGQLMNDPNSVTFYFTVAGTGAGIAIMVVMTIFALVLLASATRATVSSARNSPGRIAAETAGLLEK